MTETETIQSKGGKARAQSLSADKRREIARAAAAARWSAPKVTHSGKLTIGDLEIPCFVLEDGRRVISGRGMTTAIGMRGRGQGVSRIPSHRTLKPFISEELRMAIEEPIRLIGTSSRKTNPMPGYEATILHDLCQAVLSARDAGALKTDQEKRYAVACESLIRSFAKVGIVALVDEATGYQYVRARDALEKILEKYISDELLKWAKRFPDEFYEQLYRVRGWDYLSGIRKRPGVVGKYTNDIVYERLAPGVLEELQRLNPPNEKGRRTHRHHQWLSENIGHAALRDHIVGVIALLKSTPTGEWSQFKRTLTRVYPKCKEQVEMALE